MTAAGINHRISTNNKLDIERLTCAAGHGGISLANLLNKVLMMNFEFVQEHGTICHGIGEAGVTAQLVKLVNKVDGAFIGTGLETI